MKTRLIYIVFFVLFTVHLTGIFLDITCVTIVSKPLICLVLFILLFISTKFQNTMQKLVGVGLIFGWMGDVFLMLDNQFILGLSAFLIGHLLYLIAFLKQTKSTDLAKHKSYLFIAGLLFTYSFYIYTILEPSLGMLKIPVLFYIIVISSMVLFAYTRKQQSKKLSFILIFSAACLFMLSDTILALNKFVAYIPQHDLYIMSTYMLAQFGITVGTIVNKSKEVD